MIDHAGQNQPATPGGSLTDLVAAAPPAEAARSLSAGALIKVALFVGLLVAMNWAQFPLLLRKWHEPEWSHGFIIPLFSLYLLFSRRRELLAARRQTCVYALPLLILACLLQIGAYLIQNSLSCQVSMLLLGLALVWYLAGTKVMQLTWLPILFLAFAFPIPDLIYGAVSVPLQNLAAAGSAAILKVFGVTIQVLASRLQVLSVSGRWHSLTVAEACSGMKLLTAFLALSVAWAYLENRPVWQRIVLVAAGIPIAILCNVIRVAITATMFVFDKPDLGQDFMHEFTGMLMLVPAMVFIWLLGKLLQSIFVEVAEEETSNGADVAGGGTK